MKKILNLLIALFMCFALVACGNNKESENGSNKQDENKLIEITMENWDTYFEIKDDLYVNAVGEIYPDKVLVLKEDYDVEYVQISFDYKYTNEWYFVEIDNDKKTIEIKEVDSTKESEEKNSSRSGVMLDENNEIYVSLIDSWNSTTLGDKKSMTIAGNIEITNFDGGIELSK